MSTDTNSDTNGDSDEENGHGMDEREVRTHLKAIAETDLPYAEHARRALNAIEDRRDDS